MMRLCTLQSKQTHTRTHAQTKINFVRIFITDASLSNALASLCFSQNEIGYDSQCIHVSTTNRVGIRHAPGTNRTYLSNIYGGI